MTPTPPGREDGRETPETDGATLHGNLTYRTTCSNGVTVTTVDAGYFVAYAVAARLERERNAAREALRKIANGDVHGTWSGSQCVEIATAALLDRGGEGKR